MKKHIITVLLFVLGLAGIAGAAYNPHDNGPWGNGPNFNDHGNQPFVGAPPAQIMARNVLQRTARYLNQAQEQSRWRRYSQNIGTAFSHQRQAMDLFRQGWYERTIAHSIRARKIAIQIIQRNRGRIEDPSPFNDYDAAFIRIYSDNSLDLQIGANRMNDEDALRFTLDINF